MVVCVCVLKFYLWWWCNLKAPMAIICKQNTEEKKIQKSWGKVATTYLEFDSLLNPSWKR